MFGKESLLFEFLAVAAICAGAAQDVRFDQNYQVTWGNDHVNILNQGTQIQLSMDNISGAGFQSKAWYASGFFQMKLKIPNKDSSGVVTAFYLTSKPDNKGGSHDELDLEILGGNGSMAYTLQTNIFANDLGGREQRFSLWFDPTSDFHTYAILWNQHQIVFFVDNIPIRVFKNNVAIGVNFPSQKMVIQGSLWNGDSWAANGRKIDWSQGPFLANFMCFNVDGCQFQDSVGWNKGECYSDQLYWNGQKYWQLDANQQKALENERGNYMHQDYCSIAGNDHSECSINNEQVVLE